MSKNSDIKLKASFNKHKRLLTHRSKHWGNDKFKPKPYMRPVPPPEPEEAKPWQHVRNEIVDDEQEQRSADRFNMDSQQAKEILQQREKNHRRNVIEAQLNESTKWEKFQDDNKAGSSKAKEKPVAQRDAIANVNPQSKWKPKSKVTTKDQKKLTGWERNFVRQKLTRIANRTNKKYHESMEMMIKDLKHNKNMTNPNNKFRK
ncbi:hypothetical protein KR093_004788 [Drosophila rubida]|uniref:Uncharacterized protein n=1 Tax=Drosophila rubida TaxID=30044 RepID=A0AAD4PNP1_9MUSC|nr:hypothetical protein KR093_004788 [Drosophila rubida]